MTAATAATLAAAIAAVVTLPGAAALTLAGHPARGWERLALAVGGSITLWPLVLLWTTLAGWRWSAGSFALLIVLTGAIVVAGNLGPASGAPRPSAASLALGLILALAVGLRVWQARDLVAPPWVDGLHHTIIAQLVVDEGAIPPDYRPYLDVDHFYYHFGFHALAAGVAWLGGAETRWAVLWLGQALGALAALTTWAVARRLVGRPVAALAAAAVPACLYWFPAYFVSWARFTQLAGLVALPVVWRMVADVVLPVHPPDPSATAGTDRGRSTIALSLLAAACSAGLLLVHYRVFVFFAWGVAVGVAVDVVRQRRQAGRSMLRLTAIAVAALALVAPWLARNLAAGIGDLAAASPTWVVGSTDTVEAIGMTARQAWLFTQGTNGFWLRLASIGIAIAMWRGRRAAWSLALGLGAVALTVAPGWVGLSTSWMLPPFALAISLFLPAAWGVAWWVEAAIDACGQDDRRALRATFVAATAIVACIAGAWLARGDPGWPAALLAGDGGALAAAWASMADRSQMIVWVAALLQLGGLIGLAAGITASEAPPPASELAGNVYDERLPSATRRILEPAPTIALLALCAAGAWRMRGIVNRDTVIVKPADVAAAAWIRDHTPAGARFVVRAAHWHLGTYRGLDGGYWLPLLAGRATTMPAALYVYGDPEAVRAAQALAEELARGDALDDADLDAAMRRADADYLYIGPTAPSAPKSFTRERLRRHPGLVEVYAAAGVSVFGRREGE